MRFDPEENAAYLAGKQPEFKKMVEACPEVLLYYAINDLGGQIWRTNHDLADRRPWVKDTEELRQGIQEMQRMIEYATDQTVRFGVADPKAQDGSGSENYWRWFKWWDAWEKQLPDEEFDKLNALLDEGGDVSAFRPEGDWRA